MDFSNLPEVNVALGVEQGATFALVTLIINRIKNEVTDKFLPKLLIIVGLTAMFTVLGQFALDGGLDVQKAAALTILVSLTSLGFLSKTDLSQKRARDPRRP
jgi:hypothetical protein